MAITGEWTKIGGDLPGFVAMPASPPPWPALIVVHAIMGIDAHIEQLCARFAEEGYYAASPDIYATDPGFKQHRHEDHRDRRAYGRRRGQADSEARAVSARATGARSSKHAIG